MYCLLFHKGVTCPLCVSTLTSIGIQHHKFDDLNISLVSRICGFELAQEAFLAGDRGRFRSPVADARMRESFAIGILEEQEVTYG